jgi:hypothetical protein
MATLYYRCDGTVSTVGNGVNQGFKCSTGWIQVDEPIYSTITQQQGDALLGALFLLGVVIVVFRALGRIGF